MKEVKQIRVSSKTSVNHLANSISKIINDDFDIEVRALGAGAVNQMYKGITVARGILALKGKDLLIKPGFVDISEPDTNGENKARTAMIARLIVR